MNLRHLFASIAIVAVGLAMVVAVPRLPPGNEDIEVVCGFFGVLVSGLGVLHPFKLGWLSLPLVLAGLIALGLIFPLLASLGLI
jgi:hypothetical protein